MSEKVSDARLVELADCMERWANDFVWKSNADNAHDTALALRELQELRGKLHDDNSHRSPCEACGKPSDGYTLDDVPLCNECGREIEDSDRQTKMMEEIERLRAAKEAT